MARTKRTARKDEVGKKWPAFAKKAAQKPERSSNDAAADA